MGQRNARDGVDARRALARALACLLLAVVGSPISAQTLEEQLARTSAEELAALARREGDAVRGAVAFFQPTMACAKCHAVGKAGASGLGPDLTTLGKDVSDPSLVESVLSPSKVIRKGYESVQLATADGESLSVLLIERSKEKVVVRDVARNGELRTIPESDIEEIQVNTASIMPAGQINQLNSRQQFLDLIRYLIEIRDGGQARAMELQPSESLLTLTVPEYEQHLDHAGLIGAWDNDSLERGEAIYQRVCVNCHGTKETPGSLPTSPRFAEGKFKNGGDPLSMYRTLTHGFGLMAPQTWMVPSQKYDVIHYIREKYLRPDNSSQLTVVDADYLAKLPKGDTRGPAPSKIFAWSAMDYGPSLTHTYEVPGPKHNLAYKGVAVRLDPGSGGVSRGAHWMLFDLDTLRVAAAWSSLPASKENFIDWKGVQFDGAHGVHPHVVGQTAFANATGPGWAHPTTGSFDDDQRVEGRDGKRYGPLPRDWAKYRGLYHNGQQVVFSYSIGAADVLESPGLWTRAETNGAPLFLRAFNIGPRERDLVLQVAEHSATDARLTFSSGSNDSVAILSSPESGRPGEQGRDTLMAGFAPRTAPVTWTSQNGCLQLKIPADKKSLRFTVWLPAKSAGRSSAAGDSGAPSLTVPPIPDPERDLAALTHGGPARWPLTLETLAVIGANNGPFATDTLTAPESNPWLAQTRFTGLDFFPDGRIAVCSWDGDVWLVETSPTSGIDKANVDPRTLRWRRIATGLFQPLGLKIFKGQIHVMCRDQLAVLHDLNGDGEIDFYQCLNNDHQVTEHFHEFAMGLQTDDAGNFFYAKSARHALPAVVPHHGTLLRIKSDGSRTDILAKGFRAANGVCLNPDGSFIVTDQEGHWNPKNRINWVTVDPNGKPKFYGNMLGYHDVTDSSDAAMEPPLCWITNTFDRSPAELLWVTSDHWGPLKGSLLNLSYGYGKVFVVLQEEVHGVRQGGIIELPSPPFPTGVMRGRFHPTDGQLYLCGMYSWAGSAVHPGGLFRLRATGQSMHLPVALHAERSGLRIQFTEPLDPAAIDFKKIKIKTWSLRRTANYGSDHHDIRSVGIRDARLSADAKTLFIGLADARPTWCMEIRYSLRAADGSPVEGTIHNTIHEWAE